MANLLILLVTMSTTLMATSFVPVSVKKQITESSGILEGEIINSEAFIDKDGKILTKVFIRTDKWLGLKPKLNHTEVFFPGGVVGDRAQRIEGTPKFEIGEKVVLMLREHNEKNWILNLGLGKFMIKKLGSTKILVNSIFPKHPQVSQIPLDTFYELAARLKNRRFKTRVKDKYELEVEKHSSIVKKGRNNRAIASVKTFEQKQEESNNSTFWILIILGVFGGLFTLAKSQSNE